MAWPQEKWFLCQKWTITVVALLCIVCAIFISFSSSSSNNTASIVTGISILAFVVAFEILGLFGVWRENFYLVCAYAVFCILITVFVFYAYFVIAGINLIAWGISLLVLVSADVVVILVVWNLWRSRRQT